MPNHRTSEKSGSRHKKAKLNPTAAEFTTPQTQSPLVSRRESAEASLIGSPEKKGEETSQSNRYNLQSYDSFRVMELITQMSRAGDQQDYQQQQQSYPQNAPKEPKKDTKRKYKQRKISIDRYREAEEAAKAFEDDGVYYPGQD